MTRTDRRPRLSSAKATPTPPHTPPASDNLESRASDERLPTRLIPVTRWGEYHAWPPPGGLRHLIFHRETNGFDKVVRRAGRRVLLCERSFFEWVAKQTDEDKS